MLSFNISAVLYSTVVCLRYDCACLIHWLAVHVHVIQQSIIMKHTESKCMYVLWGTADSQQMHTGWGGAPRISRGVTLYVRAAHSSVHGAIAHHVIQQYNVVHTESTLYVLCYMYFGAHS